MKHLFSYSFKISIFFLLNTLIYSQTDDLFKDGLAPKVIDTFQDKVLIMGKDLQTTGVLSVYLKTNADTVFINITEGIDLGLNVNSKVHFDNYGVIWTFGRNNLWKYEQGQWDSVPIPADLLPTRQFRDFCFDNNNDMFVSVLIGFERFRETINGTEYVVYDSTNNELLKLFTSKQEVSFEVIYKFAYDPRFDNGAIQAMAKRDDNSIVCIIASGINNLMTFSNGKIDFTDIPFSLDGIYRRISSMAFDGNNNMWFTSNSGDSYSIRGVYNGVYKITPEGIITKWDSADGIAGRLFMKNRYPATLGVHNILLNRENGLKMCGTDFGFFTIDENKPKKEQITFYTRDSIDSRYKLLRYGGFFDHPFTITDIAYIGDTIYFANPLALLIYTNPKIVSSVDSRKSNEKPIQMEVYPIPSVQENVTLSIHYYGFLNGASLSIVDVSGVTHKTMRIEQATGKIVIPIDVIEFPSGTYQAVLTIGKEQYTKQFIILN